MARSLARERRPRRWSRRVVVAVAVLGVAIGAKLLLDRRGDRAAAAAEVRWDAIVAAVERQQWPRVEAMLRSWLEAHGDDGRARVMLAHLLATTGRSGEADEVLSPLGPDDPAWLTARMFVGESALRSFDAPAAERAFRAIIARRPDAVEPFRRLIYLYSAQLRTGEALDALRRIYEATRDPAVLVDLVLEAIKPEADVRSIGPEAERFLQQSPDDPFLQRACGLDLLWSGDPSAALPHLSAAAEGLENDPLGRLALAECRLQLGLPVEESEVLGPRPDGPADAARWWIAKARLAEASRRDAEAVDALGEAIAADPGSAEAHHRLAGALGRLGDAEGAADHERRSREIDDAIDALRRTFNPLHGARFGRDAELFERLGDRCASAGLIPEARAWYRHALDVEPDRSTVRDALDRLASRDALPPVTHSRPRRADRSPGTSPTTIENPADRSTIGPTVPRFEDVATAAGVRFRYDYGPRPDLYLADTTGGGVGMIDFDDDGWLDLYFVNGCQVPYDRDDPPRPNRLYRNRGDGTFEDVTEAAGVGGLGYGMGCTVADYDGDGGDDLFVTGLDRTILYRNRGDGTFEDVTESAGVASDRWTTASGFGDLDGDGDLDLYVVTYVEDDPAIVRTCHDESGRPNHCSPGQYPSQQDLLFRNDGGGRFTEIGARAGIEAPAGRGLGLAVADLDDDGRLDVYVANDASADFFFRNLGGLRFREDAAVAGLATDGSGHATASMGVVADDLDGDGRMDLFHTNFLNEPNTLHRNLGGGQFVDATMPSGLAAPSLSTTGFGAAALDVGNDGRLDLFLANGHVDDQPHVRSPMAQLPQLFLGRDGGRFVLADPSEVPYLARRVVGRGLAAGDLDNDGRVDLVVVHRDGPVAVLRNRTDGGHWLGLRLRGGSGGTPFGARVTCLAGGLRRVRWLTSGTGYLSAHDPRLWFGLGSSPVVDRLEVHWPDGLEQSWTDLPADRILELSEGGAPRPRPTAAD